MHKTGTFLRIVTLFMHTNATFRLWEALGQLWKLLAELWETVGEPLGGSERIWEYQKNVGLLQKHFYNITSAGAVDREFFCI